MISWRVVANLVDKVILRVAEKLVKFVQDDGIDIHHLDFLELDQLKNTAWSSDENFGSFFETFDLPFLTRARKEKLSTESKRLCPLFSDIKDLSGQLCIGGEDQQLLCFFRF